MLQLLNYAFEQSTPKCVTQPHGVVIIVLTKSFILSFLVLFFLFYLEREAFFEDQQISGPIFYLLFVQEEARTNKNQCLIYSQRLKQARSMARTHLSYTVVVLVVNINLILYSLKIHLLSLCFRWLFRMMIIIIIISMP